MNAMRTPKEDLLVGGLDDWADVGWVVQSVRLTGETDTIALRGQALALIAEVLREGLVTAGSIENGDFVPWLMETEESAKRIAEAWLINWGDEIPTPGAICWLSNTLSGDEVARAVLDREKPR